MSDIFWICMAIIVVVAIVAGAWSKKKIMRIIISLIITQYLIFFVARAT